MYKRNELLYYVCYLKKYDSKSDHNCDGNDKCDILCYRKYRLTKNLCNLAVDRDKKDRILERIKGMNNKSYNQNFKEWLGFSVKRKKVNCG